MTSFAPALSLTEAAVTASASGHPSTSTMRCRPLPLIFLPPWYPLVAAGTVSAHFTICESIMHPVGSGSRPWYARSRPRSRAAIPCGRPL